MLSTRNIHLVILVSGFLFFSCNQEKLKELELRNAQLVEEYARQDTLLNDFLDSFERFQTNIDIIKERESVIEVSSKDPEMSGEVKDQINKDLVQIGELLEENRNIIDDLNSQLEQSKGQNARFKASIARLTKQLEEKNAEITSLTEELSAKSLQIESLTRMNTVLADARDTLMARSIDLENQVDKQTSHIEAQQEEIEAQRSSLREAFYVTGTKKELRDQNILVSGKKVNPGFDPSAFTRIDMMEVKKIPLESKKVEIITFHPEGSYFLSTEGKEIAEIEITNPEEFWRTSKYLVVVKN